MTKPKLQPHSVVILGEIDKYICRHRVCEFMAVQDAPSDVLDGLAYRDEIDDPVRKGLLRIVRYDRRDWMPVSDPRMCGDRWTVAFTPYAMKALYPNVAHVNKAKGGHARAASLAPARRSEIARKAARTRWSNNAP